MAENIFSGYILYAIGEIVLLVVGILIALQINNLNEERISYKQAYLYLAEIYADLKDDVAVLNEIVQRLQEQYISSENILRIIDSPGHYVSDTLAFTKDWSASSYPLIVDRDQNTYYELRTSGNSGIIRDESLVVQLHQFYDSYDSRILNFNEYPKWVRLEKRKISYRSGTLTDYLSQKATHKETSNFIGEVLDNENNYELLLGIIKSCDFNIGFFEELSNEANGILTYLDENYPDIAKKSVQ